MNRYEQRAGLLRRLYYLFHVVFGFSSASSILIVACADLVLLSALTSAGLIAIFLVVCP